ncbi:hypothetical protein JKP88DRAFT_247318 [Tribonema minus]|uniref:Uncharacterized protein n=1 Tax=Tribonema minus TaxID=303371 RepID=A0A836CBZ4_9STRA|nr:hypothetical protein JKP88DRAFT_247318 [Tribonema minus]
MSLEANTTLVPDKQTSGEDQQPYQKVHTPAGRWELRDSEQGRVVVAHKLLNVVTQPLLAALRKRERSLSTLSLVLLCHDAVVCSAPRLKIGVGAHATRHGSTEQRRSLATAALHKRSRSARRQRHNSATARRGQQRRSIGMRRRNSWTLVQDTRWHRLIPIRYGKARCAARQASSTGSSAARHELHAVNRGNPNSTLLYAAELNDLAAVGLFEQYAGCFSMKKYKISNVTAFRYFEVLHIDDKAGHLDGASGVHTSIGKIARQLTLTGATCYVNDMLPPTPGHKVHHALMKALHNCTCS